jgi:GTP-binding protein
VFISDEDSFTLADIPGLIEGAHRGQGLGIRFLRHITRTRLLIYVLDVSENPESAFATVRTEIEAFDPALADRPALIGLNKADLVTPYEARDAAEKLRAATGLPVFAISADQGEGLAPLIASIAQALHQMDQPAVCPN